MSSSINAFKSAILRNRGLARLNRFEIEITAVPGWSGDKRDLKFLCESVNLPSKQINTLDYDKGGTTRPIKIPTGYIEDDVTMTFNLTNNYLVKKAFDAWMEKIINVDSYLLSYDSVYKRDINIAQLDENDQKVYSVQLMNAYPTTINSIDLDANSESAISKISVVFTYDKLKTALTSTATSISNSTINYIGDFPTGNYNA